MAVVLVTVLETMKTVVLQCWLPGYWWIRSC